MVVEVEYLVAYHLVLAYMQRDVAGMECYKCMREVFTVWLGDKETLVNQWGEMQGMLVGLMILVKYELLK